MTLPPTNKRVYTFATDPETFSAYMVLLAAKTLLCEGQAVTSRGNARVRLDSSWTNNGNGEETVRGTTMAAWKGHV